MATFRARYVFPVDRPPFEDAVVAFDGEQITEVGPSTSAGNAIDLGDAAIIPGLVNAHTHLEFSDLQQPLGEPGMSLPRWIREVIKYRAASAGGEDSSPGAAEREATRKGIEESLRCGVVAVGNIANHESSDIETRLDAIPFLELRALRKKDVADCIRRGEAFLAHNGAGLSPHAPYTVHRELFDASVALASKHGRPIAMHLAESRDELEFLKTSRGPFRDLLEERGWWEAGAVPLGSRPMDYLRELARAPRSLVIHGNYLDQLEVQFVAQNRDRMSFVYCPRTYEFFGHASFLPRVMANREARVALGTDSRASNPDLDLRKEMQFLVERKRIAPEHALRMGTIDGAEALGLSQHCGTLSVGKPASMAVVRIPSRGASDLHELLFDAQARVIATILRGRVVFSEHAELPK